MTKKAIAARRRYRARKGPVKKRTAVAPSRRRGKGKKKAARGGDFWEDVGNTVVHGISNVIGYGTQMLPFVM